jgi:hypothetical protein
MWFTFNSTFLIQNLLQIPRKPPQKCVTMTIATLWLLFVHIAPWKYRLVVSLWKYKFKFFVFVGRGLKLFFFLLKIYKFSNTFFFFYVEDSTKFGCEIKTYQIMEFVFRMVIRMVYSWSNNCCVIYNLGYTFVHICFCKRWLAMNFLDTCIMFFFFLLRKIKFDVLMIT